MSEGQFATRIGSPTNESAVAGYAPAKEKTCSCKGKRYLRFVVRFGGSRGQERAEGSISKVPPADKKGIRSS